MPKSKSRVWPVATTTPRGLRLSPGPLLALIGYKDRQECLSYVKHCIRRQFRLNSRTVLAQNQLRHFLSLMFHTVTRSAARAADVWSLHKALKLEKYHPLAETP